MAVTEAGVCCRIKRIAIDEGAECTRIDRTLNSVGLTRAIVNID